MAGAAAAGAARSCGRGATRASPRRPAKRSTNWLIRNGQTARLREMLWEPLALAALNQPPESAAAPVVRPRARRDVRSRIRAPRRSCCRPGRCTRCTPSRRARSSSGTAATVRTGVPPRVASPNGRSTAVEAAGERWTPDAVIAAVPWFALPTLVRAATPRRSSRRSIRHARAIGVVADRDRQPVVRSAGARRAVRRAAGPRDAVGVRQAARCSATAASHLSLVRAAPRRLVDAPNDELIAAAHAELREALPGRAARRSCCAARSSASRTRPSRWRPDSRRARRPAPPCAGCSSPATGSTPACPRRSRARSAAAIAPPTRCWR